MRLFFFSIFVCFIFTKGLAQNPEKKSAVAVLKPGMEGNIRMNSYYDVNYKKGYYLVWDIKTGKSIQYSWDSNSNSYQAFTINIPENPVPGAMGNIMFDVYFNYIDNRAYYTAWDTKTGKSVQYYWDGNNTKWAAFTVNLPEDPLPGSNGEIMVKNYYDQVDHRAYYLLYDTNCGKSIQYYWDSTNTKWSSFKINLPEKPMEGK